MESIIPVGYWIFFIVSIGGTLAGLYKLFEKAGVPGWKALVPFYNLYICTKITGKSIWWFVMLLIPVLNVVVWLLMANEISKVFGKETFWSYVASMMIPFIYFPKIAFDDKVKYIGPHKAHKKSSGREWADAIAFAVVAATLIRTFFFEAYTIPTTSMESTLKAGDFLFVSKFHYGARFPITPLAFPFAHHTMPLIKTKAYSDAVQLPYMRFPGLEDIKHNSIVVFNFPEGDTVFLPNQQNSYYSLVMNDAESLRMNDRKNNNTEKPFQFYYNKMRDRYEASDELAYRPVDKRDNYIKRCVGLPGDSISVTDGILYVNGKKAYVAPRQQKSYDIIFKENLGIPSCAELLIDMGLNTMDFEDTLMMGSSVAITANMSISESNELSKNPAILSVTLNHFDRLRYGYIGLFPHNPKAQANSVDDFSSIWIPKKGATIKITTDNYYNYQRVIEAYEHNVVTRIKKEIHISTENY
ncbi:MAG: S26 family signal peptidase [Chitinophagales bacterium]